MAPVFIIRTMTKGNFELAKTVDCAEISALAFCSKASHGYDDAFMAACRAELTYLPSDLIPGEIWVYRTEDHSISAFCDIRIMENELEVCAFFVKPDCQRQGIGTLLWDHVERRAVTSSLSRIVLAADPGAVPFYLSVGMRTYGEEPSQSVPGRMLPVMVKDI